MCEKNYTEIGGGWSLIRYEMDSEKRDALFVELFKNLCEWKIIKYLGTAKLIYS